mgnify:CR=1 FL=1
MKKKFTDEDIIRFLFEEMNPSESELLMEALYQDDSLWKRYETFQCILQDVKNVSFEPSEDSVLTVRKYVADTRSAQVKPEKKSTFSISSFSFGVHAMCVTALTLFAVITIVTTFFLHTIPSADSSLPLMVEWKDDPLLEWEPESIDQKIEEIRSELEEIKYSSTL